jgi:hypothetical protein
MTLAASGSGASERTGNWTASDYDVKDINVEDIYLSQANFEKERGGFGRERGNFDKERGRRDKVLVRELKLNRVGPFYHKPCCHPWCFPVVRSC